ASLERGNRLAEICEHEIDRILLLAGHGAPCGLLRFPPERTGIGGHSRQIRQWPENPLIALAKVFSDEMGVKGTRACMFPEVFQRGQRLRPQAVAPPVPEKPRPPCNAGQRHGAPVARAGSLAER